MISDESEGFDGYAFRFDWCGTRTPDSIPIRGVQHKVQYMRDGIVLFIDGTAATYMRLSSSRLDYAIVVYIENIMQ